MGPRSGGAHRAPSRAGPRGPEGPGRRPQPVRGLRPAAQSPLAPPRLRRHGPARRTDPSGRHDHRGPRVRSRLPAPAGGAPWLERLGGLPGVDVDRRLLHLRRRGPGPVDLPPGGWGWLVAPGGRRGPLRGRGSDHQLPLRAHLPGGAAHADRTRTGPGHPRPAARCRPAGEVAGRYGVRRRLRAHPGAEPVDRPRCLFARHVLQRRGALATARGPADVRWERGLEHPGNRPREAGGLPARREGLHPGCLGAHVVVRPRGPGAPGRVGPRVASGQGRPRGRGSRGNARPGDPLSRGRGHPLPSVLSAPPP